MSATSLAEKWVDGTAGMTRPSNVVWCDGSKAEYDRLIEEMLRDGTLLPLNARTYPSCYLHRSHPSDVARTEQLTFICTRDKQDAGPTNNWMAPPEAKAKAGAYFDGAMRGRAMYVIPYLMGPAGSTMSRTGIMVTDSAYVVASMHIMARVGNVAMAVASLPGWRVWTVGDDIAWIHVDSTGQLRAINPEKGFFGVAPNTSPKTNPNATAMVKSNTIFTNVALTPSGEPWWEGLTPQPPAGLVDWQGRPWRPGTPAAHPNSRFTVPVHQCPSVAPNWEEPQGVPISGFIFGSRRTKVIPLVFEAFDWTHGVFLGSAMSTETTAAITGQVGVVRRDPMAMLPFCGYNMADYFAHWLATGPRAAKPPRIFRVNWFRRGDDGKFLWPGYGDNLRVLKWIIERVRGGGRAQETPIGWIPTPDALDTAGLAVSRAQLNEALRVDHGEWLQALATRIVGDMAASFSMALGHIGDRLGLFRAMKGAGPVASAQLAAKTALNERYVREWLKAMAASEYLDYDPTSDTYVMTAEQAYVLADDASPMSAG